MRIVIKITKEKQGKYIPLHVHSEYSVLDGMCRISPGKLSIKKASNHRKSLVDRAIELGFGAIAITDHGTLGGFYRFYHECKDKGIKPIIGYEAYIVDDVNRKEKGEKTNHIVLLAKDYKGLKGLFELSSRAFLEGFYRRPRIDMRMLGETIDKYGNSFIALSACIAGVLPQLLLKNENIRAMKYVNHMLEMFDGDFYGEIMPHQIEEQQRINRKIVKLSKTTDLKVIATNDVHYIHETHFDTHEVLLCVQTNSKINDENRFSFGQDNTYYLSNFRQMLSMFSHTDIDLSIVEKALHNTLEISDKINIELPENNKSVMPIYKVPDRFKDKRSWITHMCIRQLNSIGKYNNRYADRLKRELNTIEKMGFLDYFLIVKELCDFVKENGILKGPSRGSAAGCLVSYLLGITSIDPIKYELLFERFLNEAKVSPPDIDLDFDDSRRNEIFAWFDKRFGKDNSAHIGTWGQMKGRLVFRDVSRALDVDLKDVDRVSKFIYQKIGDEGETVLEDSFKDYKQEIGWFEEKYPQVVQNALVLEGLIRQKGVHASGVVVSAKSLIDYMPVEFRRKKKCTALTGKEVEDLGFLKFDILGLKTLRVINHTLNEIRKNTGVEIDLENIPLDDEKCYVELSKGSVAGIFQLDSLGCAKECRMMGLSEFNDIVAMTALYRPGTMRSGLTAQYIARKNDLSKIESVSDDFDRITKDTFGIPIYQEQVIKIFNEVAGLSKVEADKARVVIAKSHGKEAIEEYREKVVSGFVEGGIKRKKADKIFDQIIHFSAYAFNKSHAVSYGMITYYTIYLKCNYPVEYFAGLLSSGVKKEEVSRFVKDAKRLGIKVLMPNINKSGWDYRVEKRKGTLCIRAGLRDIDGVGEKAGYEIEYKQPFKDFVDFYNRVEKRVVNKKVVVSLIKAGCFDGFTKNRKAFLNGIEDILAIFKKNKGSSNMPVLRREMKLWEYEESFTEVEKYKVFCSVTNIPYKKSFFKIFEEEILEIKKPLTMLDLFYTEDFKNRERFFVIGSIVGKEIKKIKDYGEEEHRSKYKPGESFIDIHIQDDCATIRIRFHPDSYKRNKDFFDNLCDGEIAVVEGTFFKQAELFIGRNIEKIPLSDSFFSKRLKNDIEIYDVEREYGTFHVVDSFDKQNVGDLVNIVGVITDINEMGGEKGFIATIEGVEEGFSVLIFRDHWRVTKKAFEIGNKILAQVKKLKDCFMFDDNSRVFNYRSLICQEAEFHKSESTLNMAKV